MINRKVVKRVIEKYKRAWMNQDADAIIKIFTKNAVYHERALEKPIVGHSGIRKYWQNKVIDEQKNIHFKLLHLYVDKNTTIAEWEVTFFDKKRRIKVHMKEVAILEIKNNKIASLREYWASEHI